MNVLLVMNLPPELEEDMVDYLLSVDLGGFTSYLTRGHGSQGDLSIAEQVSGRRQRLQFEILLEEGNVDQLLAGLEPSVGKDIIYWVQPVSRRGRV
ncbi:MAG: hypothetical protein RLZZ385_1005 [Pseudomonadota bacterium]|jgi:hypothetical protein